MSLVIVAMHSESDRQISAPEIHGAWCSPVHVDIGFWSLALGSPMSLMIVAARIGPEPQRTIIGSCVSCILRVQTSV